MNLPLLHLMRHDTEDTGHQHALIDALMPVGRAEGEPAWVVCADDVFDSRPPRLILEAIRRAPALESLGLRYGLVDHPLSSDSVGLLVFAGTARPAFGLLDMAVRQGIPVLVPDTWDGALIRDGVTGFFYRDENPGSLALSLIALTRIAPDHLERILNRAVNEWLSKAPMPLPERLQNRKGVSR